MSEAAHFVSTRAVPKVRRVVGGFAYDTETASVLYRYDSCVDGGGNPFNDYEVGLLQNVWGHYFCYCWEQGREEEGYRLTPLTREEAIKWAERHCNWQVEEIFGRLHEAGEGPAYTPKLEEQ